MKFFRTKKRCGFTLIELLVVITIIATLVAVGGAAYATIADKARSAKCVANLRQLGIASVNHEAENNGKLPQSSHGESWTSSLGLNVVGGLSLVCPADHHPSDVSYAINDMLQPSETAHNPLFASQNSGPDYSRVLNIPKPSRTMLFGEKTGDSDHFHFSTSSGSFAEDVAVERHRGAANYLFVDGHVENLTWTEAQERLSDPSDPFIDPANAN